MQSGQIISGSNMRRVIFYLACFIFLYLHLFTFPVTPIYYEADHVNLLNDAKRMVEGEVIYRDFFEFVFPGAPGLFALLMMVFGPKYWLVNAVIIAHGMLAAFLGVQISRRVIADNAVAYLPSAIFLFFGFRWLGLDGEHRMLSPLFAYLAIFLLLRERTLPRIALAGAACSFASFFSQQRGFLTAAAILIFLFFEFAVAKREWGRFFRSALVLGAVSAGLLFMLLLPFILAAGFERFFDSTVVFLTAYVQDPETNSLNTYVGTLAKIKSHGTIMLIVSLFYSVVVPCAYIAVIAVALVRWRKTGASGLDGILLVSSIGLFLALGTSGPNASRLFQVALPGVIALVWLTYQTGLLRVSVAKLSVAALVVLGIVLGFRLQMVWDTRTLETPTGRLVFLSSVGSERYEWLLENADPDDLVYETYNSHVNFPLGLRNPSRMSILLNSGYSPPEHVAWAIEDLKRTNPRYIIWDGVWTGEIEQHPENQRLEPFYRYMTSNYRRIRSFTPYDGREREIWERSDLSGENRSLSRRAE